MLICTRPIKPLLNQLALFSDKETCYFYKLLFIHRELAEHKGSHSAVHLGNVKGNYSSFLPTTVVTIPFLPELVQHFQPTASQSQAPFNLRLTANSLHYV